MLATKFLTECDFGQYRHWLESRDPDTLSMYFGVSVSKFFIDATINKILANPENHHFLVATDGERWVGVIHMARISEQHMEFGVMVDEEYRGQGIANQLMQEAIVWIQNRGFDTLYLHCLNRNSAMKHLAQKHGLELHEEYGDIEATTHVPPPSVLSYAQEALTTQKNIFFLNLRNAWAPLGKIYG